MRNKVSEDVNAELYPHAENQSMQLTIMNANVYTTLNYKKIFSS